MKTQSARMLKVVVRGMKGDRDLARQPLGEVVDHFWGDVAGLAVFGLTALAVASHEKVIQGGVAVENNVFSGRQSGLPESEVGHRNLKITLTLEDQHRNRYLLGDGSGVVALEIRR